MISEKETETEIRRKRNRDRNRNRNRNRKGKDHAEGALQDFTVRLVFQFAVHLLFIWIRSMIRVN